MVEVVQFLIEALYYMISCFIVLKVPYAVDARSQLPGCMIHTGLAERTLEITFIVAWFQECTGL